MEPVVLFANIPFPRRLEISPVQWKTQEGQCGMLHTPLQTSNCEYAGVHSILLLRIIQHVNNDFFMTFLPSLCDQTEFEAHKTYRLALFQSDHAARVGRARIDCAGSRTPARRGWGRFTL